MVARVVWDHQAAGSSPVASTIDRTRKNGLNAYFFGFLLCSIFAVWCLLPRKDTEGYQKKRAGKCGKTTPPARCFLLVGYVFIRGIHIDGAPVYPCPQHPVIVGMPNRRGGLCVLFIHAAAPHPIQEHGQTEAAEADPFRSRCSQRSPSADSYTRCFYSPRESPSFALDICRMAHKWRNIRSRFGLS